MDRTVEEAAVAARDTAKALGDTLYRKQKAYGNSGAIALGLWKARLEQYRLVPAQLAQMPKQTFGKIRDEDHYLIPASLLAHIPRITRLDDRINRLISNPGMDLLGENPWLDAAGDCIIGAIAPLNLPEKAPAQPDLCGHLRPHGPFRDAVACDLRPGHIGRHRVLHAGGVESWDQIEAGVPNGDQP